MDRHYNHYDVDGHTRNTCFELHGYPNWYKDLWNTKSKPTFKAIANLLGAPLDKEQDSKNVNGRDA